MEERCAVGRYEGLFDRGITIATAFDTKWSQTEDWQDCIVRQVRNVRYIKYLTELAPWRSGVKDTAL